MAGAVEHEGGGGSEESDAKGASMGVLETAEPEITDEPDVANKLDVAKELEAAT